MELRQLRTLLAIVEQGGYGRAAEALGYTQSAVTAQIRQLEEELGFPLFERMGRRMVLTERGAAAVDKARRLLQLSDELLRMGEDGGLSGVLRVDMAESLLCYRMQPVLRAFRSQAPQVELILRSAGCRDIARHVRSGQCDLGVGYDDPQWWAEPFSTEVWGECQMSLLFSPRLSPPDLALPCQRLTVPYIADEPDSTFRRQLERYLRLVGKGAVPEKFIRCLRSVGFRYLHVLGMNFPCLVIHD